MAELIIKDKVMLYDEADQAIVDSYKWHLNSHGYAVWRGIVDGKKQTVRLHRLINGTPDGMITDHINRNRLDNRRENLRTCTQFENMQNSGSVLNAKGYYFDNRRNYWTVDAKRHGYKSIYLSSEQDAIDFIADVRAGKQPKRVFIARPKDKSCYKMTQQKADKVRKLVASGLTRASVAEMYGVCPSAIGRIVDGKTWKGMVTN